MGRYEIALKKKPVQFLESVKEPKQDINCFNCNGTGFRDPYIGFCSRCGGSGKIPENEIIYSSPSLSDNTLVLKKNRI
jgi:hypothetical protein